MDGGGGRGTSEEELKETFEGIFGRFVAVTQEIERKKWCLFKVDKGQFYSAERRSFLHSPLGRP